MDKSVVEKVKDEMKNDPGFKKKIMELKKKYDFPSIMVGLRGLIEELDEEEKSGKK